MFVQLLKKRKLADFYITRLSNDMKIAVQKNHLRSKILYQSLDPPKKRRQSTISELFLYTTYWVTRNRKVVIYQLYYEIVGD